MDRHDRRHLPSYEQMLTRGFQYNSVPEMDHIDAIGIPPREPVGTVFGFMEPMGADDIGENEEPELFFPSNKPSFFQRHQDLDQSPTLSQKTRPADSVQRHSYQRHQDLDHSPILSQKTRTAGSAQHHSPVLVQRTPLTNSNNKNQLQEQRKQSRNANTETVEADCAPSYGKLHNEEENANQIIPSFTKVDPRKADLVNKLWEIQGSGSVDSGLGSSSINFPSRDETSFVPSVSSIEEGLKHVSIQEYEEGPTDSARISITPPSEKELSGISILERQTSIVQDKQNGNRLNEATAKFQRNMKYFEQDSDLDTNLHHLLYADRDEDFTMCLDDLMSYHMLDVANRRKQTLLHVAAIMDNPKLCRAIMVHGSSVDCRDYRGNTPLHIACQKGSMECVEVLTKHLNYNEVKDLGYQVPFRCIPQSMELRNYDGETCLHLAAAGGHYDIVHYLVHDMMADINTAEGKRGLTPLMQCVERRDARMLMYLVQQCSANIHLRTYDRKNALELAQGHGYTEIANLLKTVGAEGDIEDDEDFDWIEEDIDDSIESERSVIDE